MSKNTMRFVCNEDFSKMPKTNCGRYCAVCEREVIDFRGVPKHQLEALRGKDVCGIFLPEQVEDGISPIQLPKARFVAATFLTFLGLETHAQTELNTTQSIPTEFVVDDTISIAETGGAIQPEGRALTKKEIRYNLKRTVYNHKPFIRTGRATYYWSRRFPFIVRRRVFRGGKF